MKEKHLDKKQIEYFKNLFQATYTVLDSAYRIAKINDPCIQPNPMLFLHRLMLMEVSKDNPDRDIVLKLLIDMENLANDNSKAK